MFKIKIKDTPDFTLRGGVFGGQRLNKVQGTIIGHDFRKRYVLLIHGYNVNEKKAMKAYNKFKVNLLNVSRFYEREILTFIWPSDFVGFPIVNLIDPFFYSIKIDHAKDCSNPMYQFLLDLEKKKDNALELIIIAHSLGCRLILETLKKLIEDDNFKGKIKFILVLMAAAIPVELVKNNQSYRSFIKEKVHKKIVLYSKDDKILSKAFPFGQTINSIENTNFPEAVGLNGNPNDGLWSYSKYMKGFDHGSYWKKKETAKVIAYELGERKFLSLNYRSSIPMRKTPLRNHLPDRNM